MERKSRNKTQFSITAKRIELEKLTLQFIQVEIMNIKTIIPMNHAFECVIGIGKSHFQ